MASLSNMLTSQDSYTDLLETRTDRKVFGIGLSRTGTTSLTEALRILGYDAFHFDSPEGKILDWPDFYKVEAATDTSVCVHFPALYRTFPNALFVYTTRKVSEWKTSIQNHFNSESPKQTCIDQFNKSYVQGSKRKFYAHNSYHINMIHSTLYGGCPTWEQAYSRYEGAVYSFFSNEDKRLLKFNLTGGDGWHKLCSFLDAEVPAQPFPHSHKSQG
jgi:hypothetical protein